MSTKRSRQQHDSSTVSVESDDTNYEMETLSGPELQACRQTTTILRSPADRRRLSRSPSRTGLLRLSAAVSGSSSGCGSMIISRRNVAGCGLDNNVRGGGVGVDVGSSSTNSPMRAMLSGTGDSETIDDSAATTTTGSAGGSGHGSSLLVATADNRLGPERNFKHLLLTYLERTSAHALPRVARSPSRLRRVLWLGTFAFFVGYFIYQFAALLSMFYSYPVGATIFIEQRDFSRRVSPFFGNCFTFNHLMNDTPILSSKYGSRFGLRLTLNIEHDEYLGLFSHKAGVRVTIHPVNVTPYPEDVGLNAMPGCETEIGIAVEAIKRVPFPHPSNCTARKTNLFPGNSMYTVLSCSKHCLQRKLEQFCGCVDSEVTFEKAVIVRCVSTNSSQERCRQWVRHHFENDLHDCDCPPPCEEIRYKTTVSSAAWPSEPYASLLASVLVEDKTFADPSDIYNSIKRNLASVHIYMTDMNVRRIEEYPSYPWDRLLADIGGMLGLFIGISACTAMELVEFFFDALLLAVAKCRIHRMTSLLPTVAAAAAAGRRSMTTARNNNNSEAEHLQH